MDVAASIRKLREEHELTQEQLGEIAGVSSMAVSQWENGRAVPRMGSIQRMADYFGVPKSVIMGDKDEGPSAGLRLVSLFGSVAAGMPIEMIPVDEVREVPAKFVEEDPDCFLVRVKGNSMNKHIHDDDFALVSPRFTEINDHDMFLISVNGDDATIKHARKLANGVELVPDSYDPTYRTVLIDFGDEAAPPLRVLGKVVWWCAAY